MPDRQDPLEELIRHNLIRFRQELNLTQQQAATDAGIPMPNLRRYELGERVPSMAMLKRLANALGRTVNDFVEPDPPPARPEDRPVFFVRMREDAEMDAEIYAECVRVINDANIRYREKLRRKNMSPSENEKK